VNARAAADYANSADSNRAAAAVEVLPGTVSAALTPTDRSFGDSLNQSPSVRPTLTVCGEESPIVEEPP
jgi:hypothetical protein